jgi:hypothetical protein
LEFAIRKLFPTTHHTLRSVAGIITHASELLEYELKQGELLEARIARKIKFLVELKTMEQMLGKS